MPILPLLGRIQVEAIRSRIKFLSEVVRFAPPQAPESAEPEETGERALDVAPLLRAADLAFAVDQTRQGLDLLMRAVESILRSDWFDRRVAALPGAIAKAVETNLSPNSIHLFANYANRGLAPLGFQGGLSVAVDSPPLTPWGLELRTELLVAAAASSRSQFELAGSAIPLEPVTGDPIVSALAIFDARFGDGAQESVDACLVANAVTWAERLRLLRSDRHHWDLASFRAPLVDFRRLGFELARLRRRADITFGGGAIGRGLAAELNEFVKALAKEIETKTVRR
jgi:hypothetical protein